ncbi:hypothetical protein ACJJTC_002195 [Scirpophaga incertulas]
MPSTIFGSISRTALPGASAVFSNRVLELPQCALLEHALIAQKRGTASRDQDHLVQFVEAYSTAVVSAESPPRHGFYETLPQPRILYERVRQDLLASQRGNQPDLDWFPEGLAPVLPRDQPDLDPAVRRPRDDDHGQPDIDREGGGAPLDD